MGTLRLFVEETPAVETTVALPEFWDELDEEEKKQWVSGQVVLFRSIHFQVKLTLSE